MKSSETLTPVQAAKLLRLTRQRIYQLQAEGKLATRPVSVIEHRIPIGAVEALLEERRQAVAAKEAKKAERKAAAKAGEPC